MGNTRSPWPLALLNYLAVSPQKPQGGTGVAGGDAALLSSRTSVGGDAN